MKVLITRLCKSCSALSLFALMTIVAYCGLSLPVLASPKQTALLERAVLESATGTREVSLPHVLSPTDFSSNGGLVRYRLGWELAETPQSPQAAYVSKLSLSGRLYVNGQLVGDCGHAPLEELRCLHQPQYFQIPAALVQVGINTLEFEILATPRQMNGLSQVRVGDADTLFETFYVWRYFLSAELQVGLMWLSVLLGLLSLTVGLILRRESVFIWFGLTSIINAVASLNGVVVHPRIDIDVYNWVVFWSRLVSVPLAFLTLLAIFGKDGRRITWLLGGYSLAIPLIIALSGNSRAVTFALYVPLVFSCPVLLGYAIRWTRQTRHPLQIVSTIMMVLLFSGGVVDWLRLGGQTAFEGIYLSSYTYSGMLITMGLLLLSRLAGALLQSQKMGAMLEQKVAERIAYEVTENIPIGTFTIIAAPGQKVPSFNFMSRRFLQITGLDRHATGRDLQHVFSRVHPDDRPKLRRLSRQAFRNRQPFAGRLRMVVDGETRWIHVESAPRDLTDGSTVWEGVLIDETEQVLTQEAAEQDRAALQAYQLARSRAQEREALLRDVHDGFGSQLASVRLMVEKGRIPPEQLPDYLQELSADLHLVVDTLGQSDITLEDAIHDMRYRTERRFGTHAIRFDWQLALKDMPPLTSRHILQILRIAQEAMHNAIRHADAQHITLSARFDAARQHLLLTVQDDGVGMPEQPPRGRGLDNMRHRAREVGGHLHIRRTHPGTLVQFELDTGRWTPDPSG